MCQFNGELASGYMTYSTNSHPRYIRERCVPSLAEGAHAAGRDVTSIPLVAGACFVTGWDSDELAESRQAQRRKFAFLYSTPAYRPTLELCGYTGGALQDELRRLVRSGDWDALGSVVSDEVLDHVPQSRDIQRAAGIAGWALSPDWLAASSCPRLINAADDARFRKVLAAIQAID